MEKMIYAISQDPIYIGTGGFTIGRVDNTIVRDPVTRLPKIPGTSLSGTWRYYMALTLQTYFKNEYRNNMSERNKKESSELFESNAPDWAKEFNRNSSIKCAGQDEDPENDSGGHCGRCIVCNTFGYSKNNRSKRGLAYFSDLNILFFPVYTRLGTKWITSKQILNDLEPDICKSISEPEDKGEDSAFCNFETGTSLNLGWLNFKVSKFDKNFFDTIGEDDFKDNFKEVIDFIKDKIVIVSDSVISQIVNSNLEVRTSVSIDPITGAAKDKALFTSEAIPRGTVFYGNVRIQNSFEENGNISEANIIEALEDSKKYFEVMGIGGMTTRGFGRIKLSSLTKEKRIK